MLHMIGCTTLQLLSLAEIFFNRFVSLNGPNKLSNQIFPVVWKTDYIQIRVYLYIY